METKKQQQQQTNKQAHKLKPGEEADATVKNILRVILLFTSHIFVSYPVLN